MLRKNSFYACIFIVNLAALSYSASLSGVIKDSTKTPINGVKIILTGLSVTGFVDSVTTGTDGAYAFDSLVIGTYSLSLTDSGFIKK